jgi:Family of unknown function (DUF6665)
MGQVIFGNFRREWRGKAPTPLEKEIARERASALGRAGKKLEASLERYRLLVAARATAQELDLLLDEIAQNVWSLVVQRELIGFIHENLHFVRERFEIPAAAFSRMGRRRRVRSEVR